MQVAKVSRCGLFKDRIGRLSFLTRAIFQLLFLGSHFIIISKPNPVISAAYPWGEPMQKDSLLTVKKAAEKLGLEERIVMERLTKGDLKGEKRSNWLRDEWFVSNGAVLKELAKKKESGPGEPNPNTKLAERPVEVEAEAMPDDHCDDDDWLKNERSRLEQIVEHVMRPLVERVAAQAEALAEKDRIIQEQDIKLRLLPDLEKKAREHDELVTKKTVEISELRQQLSDLINLKEQLDEVEKSKLELEGFMNQEVDRLKREKELNEEAARSQMDALAKELEELRKPWWKKWFASV